MGMFDSVIRPPIKCPGCGRELNSFQSKSGFRRDLQVTPEQLIQDSERMWGNMEVEYYDYCIDGCGGAVFYTYNPDKPNEGWKMKYKSNEDLYGGEE